MPDAASGLYDLLVKKRPAILKQWFKAIIETYPPDASAFLGQQTDRFANPVGAIIQESIGVLYDSLAHDEPESSSCLLALDDVVRLRAIQDFDPGRAVGFIFQLKKLVRRELKDCLSQPMLMEELLAFESRVDSLILAAFNNYMSCREKVYELKVSEIQRSVRQLLAQASGENEREAKA